MFFFVRIMSYLIFKCQKNLDQEAKVTYAHFSFLTPSADMKGTDLCLFTFTHMLSSFA